MYDEASELEQAYRQGYQDAANQPLDLNNVEFNNPIVNACWIFTLIKYGLYGLGSIGFLIYFAYMAIHG